MVFNVIYDILNQLSQFSLTAYILLFTVCILLHRVVFSKSYDPPLPPSPGFRLPIIGHLHLLDHDLRKPFRKYHKQLGDVFSLQLGERLVIVLGRYEVINEAFQKSSDMFMDRPNLYVADHTTRKAGLALTSGDIWKEHRQFTLRTLKDFGMGKSKLEGKIHEEVKAFLAEIRDHKGEPFDPGAITSTHVANVIGSMAFKGEFKHDDERFLSMLQMMNENLTSSAGVANFLPWAAHLPGDPLKYKKLLKNADKIFEFCEDIIAEHVKDYDENDIDDYTSAYIKESRRLESIGKETTMNCGTQLAACIADLYMAGLHTTATTIKWSIVCLVNFPRVQEKLYKEISECIGTEKLPSGQDRPSLQYLEAFYMEVLRYCNITITSGPHAAIDDVTFRGFTIPKNAIILPDMDSIFNDRDIWQDPENFRPERFLNDDGSIRKREEMIAFFLGKRSCVGESLARIELLIFIGALVQHFILESPSDEHLTVEKVDGLFGFGHAPKPYKVVARQRLSD